MQRLISVAPKHILDAFTETMSQDEARAQMLRLRDDYRKSLSTGEIEDVREDPHWLKRLFYEAAA